MQEEIKNFDEMIIKYYEECGKKNMVFTFLHIYINYTYVDLNSPLLEVNNDGIPSFNNGKRKRSELILVPIILNKEDYIRLFSDDESYDKRTFKIKNVIDVGTSYNFNYDKVYKTIASYIPENCHIVNNAEIKRIANIKGYENIFWYIEDENKDVLKDYELEPNWITKVYGIKKLEQEKTK